MMIERYKGWTMDRLKQDREALLSALKEVAGSKDLRIRGNSLCCPFCSDKRPSAGIYTNNGDGLWRFKCQRADCGFNGSIIDIIAKADGIDTAEVFRLLRSDTKPRTQPKVYETIELLQEAIQPIESIYPYTNPDTREVDMYVYRLRTPKGKAFRIAKPIAGGFVQQAPDKPWPLYNRGRLQTADKVIVVEGEKCVHILHKYGIVATTSPGGCGKASYADWTLLKNKHCILWPDPELSGVKHMQEVSEILQGIAKTVRIIDPAELGLTGKEDVEQYIQRQSGDIRTALVKAFIKAKVPRSIADGVGELIDNVIEGKLVCIPWKWPILSNLTKALKPENILIICGGLGASKSFKLLEAAAYWHKQGIEVAIFELEESREFHLLRSLAQESKTKDITDYDWIKDNPEQAKAIFEKYKSFLDSFGVRMKATPDKQPTLDELAVWIEDRARAGCRIIGIDPITAVGYRTKASYREDEAFLHNIQKSATDHQCSIILVTHPIKAGNQADITLLSGGAAYQRFAQTVLWLESHDTKTSKVRFDVGTTEEQHNRTLHILKARQGPGQGTRLAYNFQVEGLSLEEIGIIARK